jgi:hypothetical protein
MVRLTDNQLEILRTLARPLMPAATEPLTPTSGIGGAPLPRGGSFLNHGHPGRR